MSSFCNMNRAGDDGFAGVSRLFRDQGDRIGSRSVPSRSAVEWRSRPVEWCPFLLVDRYRAGEPFHRIENRRRVMEDSTRFVYTEIKGKQGPLLVARRRMTASRRWSAKPSRTGP